MHAISATKLHGSGLFEGETIINHDHFSALAAKFVLRFHLGLFILR